MRRPLGIIISVAIVLGVLAGLSALGSVELEREPEREYQPVRSSYNAGPTGTRAFYQLLDESGAPVARWRESFASLAAGGTEAALITVGPFPLGEGVPESETRALREWVAAGGRALVISRWPREQFGDPAIEVARQGDSDDWGLPPERLVDERSDDLIAQPTGLARGLRGLAVSRLASRLRFRPAGDEKGAPVVHLGDGDGAVLADFDYGRGRVIFLSDPFVVANNGIARGANLALALNLVGALGGDGRRILFDEYHHGHRGEGNALIGYFRGTPAPWLLAQGLLLAALVGYSAGRRFARPLPLPREDRHSPLEFVGSMASLQQAAEARDLALENIYPRFKAKLTRALGVPARARPPEIAAALGRRRLDVAPAELLRTLEESEQALAGEPIDDHRLVALVATMRRVSAQLR
jgi:Domain of unknown function (DUF4350)